MDHRISRHGGIRVLFLLVLAGAARLAWLLVVPRGAVSLDLLAWKAVAIALLRGLNPYQVTHWLNYPPFWMEVIFCLARLSAQYGVDFIFALRLVLVAGDLGLLAATYLLLRALQPEAHHTRLLVIGYCLNPLLVLLTIQHGNPDAFCMIGVVLFLYFVIRHQRSGDVVDWLWAAGCLGLAVFVKQFPLVLWPLLAPGARQVGWRGRIVGAMCVASPAVLSLAPLYVLAPGAITENVLQYRSLGNTFGIAGLLTLTGYGGELPGYSRIFTGVVLAGTAMLAVLFWHRRWRREIDPVLLANVTLLSLFVLGPGYGSQYWFWIVPLALVCYSSASASFRRVIVLSLLVVVATNIFEYAVEANLGCFFVRWFPSSGAQSLSDYFAYPSLHLIWLRLPMGFASFGLLLAGVRDLFSSYVKQL
jgi:Glycosyltransferase family 87